jgi:RNA polymerase sigma-70 factor (ECF subfamily)
MNVFHIGVMLVSNEELMILYAKGDAQAFDDLFERIHQRIYNYVARRLKNKSEVDDVVQNIFIKFHSTKERYDSSYPLDAWIFTISRSVLFDHLRKVSKIKSEEFFEFHQEELKESPDIDQAMSKLPEESQKIIKLRYEDDLTFEEIAQRMNKGPANIRQIISRALRFLRKENEV